MGISGSRKYGWLVSGMPEKQIQASAFRLPYLKEKKTIHFGSFWDSRILPCAFVLGTAVLFWGHTDIVLECLDKMTLGRK